MWTRFQPIMKIERGFDVGKEVLEILRFDHLLCTELITHKEQDI